MKTSKEKTLPLMLDVRVIDCAGFRMNRFRIEGIVVRFGLDKKGRHRLICPDCGSHEKRLYLDGDRYLCRQCAPGKVVTCDNFPGSYITIGAIRRLEEQQILQGLRPYIIPFTHPEVRIYDCRPVTSNRQREALWRMRRCKKLLLAGLLRLSKRK